MLYRGTKVALAGAFINFSLGLFLCLVCICGGADPGLRLDQSRGSFSLYP